MRIHQVNTDPKRAHLGDPILCGKWWCISSTIGPHSLTVCRYLQPDGSWGKNTHYFNTKDELQAAADIGIKPDFTMSQDELEGQLMMRDDCLRGMDEMFERE